MATEITLAVLVNMVLVLMGVVVLNGKGDRFISGYNTASPEKKAQYDIVRLRSVTAVTVFVVAFLSTLFMCTTILVGDNENLVIGLTIGFTVLIILLVAIAVVLQNTYCKIK